MTQKLDSQHINCCLKSAKKNNDIELKNNQYLNMQL